MSKHQNLVLIGAGGFGKEIEAWIRFLSLPFHIIGFLDDQKTGPNILGHIKGHSPLVDTVYLCCLGNGAARHAIRLSLEARGAIFTQLVDPIFRCASPIADSKNSIFLGHASLANNIVLGSDLLIHAFSVVGHDVGIGDGVTVGAHAFVGGAATLKACSTVHPGAKVLPQVTVGEHAIVGAGSVVIRNVAAHTTVFGAPAKVISTANG